MIIQSSNKPIIVEFSEDITDSTIKATLWNGTSKLKEWKRENMVIDGKTLELPLTQEETSVFPVCKARFEIKWLNDDGYTEFSKNEDISIISRKDRTIMEVS